MRGGWNKWACALGAVAGLLGASWAAAATPAEPLARWTFAAALEDAAFQEGTHADSLADAELAATTAPPWVPGHPVPAGEGWETALRLPGRVATLPLSALGYLTERTMIVVEDTKLIPKVGYFLAVLPQAGLTLGPASLGDRTGLGISAGLAIPGIRRFLTANWNGSTLDYNRTRVTARAGLARLDYVYEWRPQDRFYGLGPSSSEHDTSTYAAQAQQIRLGLAQHFRPGGGPGAPRLDVAAWIGPREIIMRRGREEDVASFEERFPVLQPLLDHRYEHLVYGTWVSLDRRLGVPRWSQGGRISVEVERFDRPQSELALRTTHVPFQFTRWVYEAEGGLSLYRDPRTIRLSARVVDNDPTDGNAVPLSDLATLGGGRGLEGFEPGRFHDLDALVGRLTYLFPLAMRFELDVHIEAGSVYRDIWRDARFSGMRTSYGVALRPRLDTMILGSVGVDWSNEAVRLGFTVGGVE